MADDKKRLILTTLVCMVPVIIGIILYPTLPDEMVIHWDASGEPNGFASKFVGAIVLPASLVALNIVLPLIARLDPKYKNINHKLMSITYWIIPMISILCSTITFAYALGYDLHVEQVMPAVLGVLFIIIGNYLPKTKQSYTMGIKLPWTLHSEENWNKTHRLAGFLWVICGFVCVICGILRSPIGIMAAVLVVAVVVPTVYSFVLYKKGI